MLTTDFTRRSVALLLGAGHRFFFVLQALTLLIPVAVFVTYIVAAEGDQWTSEHFLATGMFAIPFFIVLILKYIVFGRNET